MRNAFYKLTVIVGLMAFGVFGCDQPTTNLDKETKNLEKKVQEIMSENGEPIPGQYIVVFKEEGKTKMKPVKVKEKTKLIMSSYKIQSDAVVSKFQHSLKGFTAQLTDRQVKMLKDDERVDYVEQDRIVMLSPPKATGALSCILLGIGCDTSGGNPQVTPYGITRVGGPVDGSGLTAWIIDTGIDLDHPDLNVDTERSVSFVTTESSPNDGNGHGTHVAGTIAAINNDIDVVGVAAGATVVAVKVLGSTGSGTTSGVIEGVDYVAANASPGDVANMSLGGGTSEALDDAVRNAANQGIYFAIAAGNSSEHASNSSPARVDHTNVWTLSAIDENDNFASFSNYGNPPIDYAAPGVDVKSLWKNNGVNTISGTSMASPHAAGVLLITGGNPTGDGTAIGDPDGNPDPVIHN